MIAAATYVVGMLGVVWFGPYQFASAGRFLMAAFPAFAVLGEVVARRGWAIRITFASCSTAAALVLAWGFLTGRIAIPW